MYLVQWEVQRCHTYGLYNEPFYSLTYILYSVLFLYHFMLPLRVYSHFAFVCSTILVCVDVCDIILLL